MGESNQCGRAGSLEYVVALCLEVFAGPGPRDPDYGDGMTSPDARIDEANPFQEARSGSSSLVFRFATNRARL
ncbi:MAG: hypothetical protein AB1646_01695 [Thermodesulfobacteriota bacterium]